ncbi:double zinc ribbon domain-containing protein [Flavobacterium chungnamense]|uniref:DZANK-type domain-containing protein n=1 Tax=Flavobacterium chungnamense TaxID=706182 RepID=A0ABP7UUK8_9FLAO
MNCPNCKSIYNATDVFCGECGFNLQSSVKKNVSTLSCTKCNHPIKESDLFCGECGTSNQVISKNTNNQKNKDNLENSSMSVIKDRIFWNIKAGEIAHRFNETDLIQYESAKGIIINEGSTAYIKANGELVAELTGGTYNFVEPEQLQQILETREGGIAGGLRNGFRFISNLVMGTRVKDKIDSNTTSNVNQQTTLSSVIESMKKNQDFAVTLKLDKSFQIPFGRIEDCDGNEMESLIIKTKLLDMEFAVDAFFKIDDFKKFAQHYLSDNSSVTKKMIHNELFSLIKAAIQDVMQDVEVSENRLSEELIQKISNKINTTAEDLFYGLKLEKIITISSSNEDLERFRALSRELYLSEREFEHLANLNEMNTRLSLHQNAQRLIEARNDFEFHKELQAINNNRSLHDERTELDFDKESQSIFQERLLSEDDLEKFYMVLSREKRIREATNENEIQTALIEIEKTGLLREEDLENLKRSIRERNEDHDIVRFHAIDIIQLNQTLEIDRKNLEWEYEIGDKRIELELDRKRKALQAEIGFTELEIEQWKKEDDYKDSRFYTDLQKSKAGLLQDIEIDKTRAKNQLEIERERLAIEQEDERLRFERAQQVFKRDQEHELKTRDQELLHIQELEEKRLKEVAIKYQGAKDLTAEQLMAIAANEKLDPIAAQKFAESFSAKHNNELQKEHMEQFNKLNEQRIEDIRQSNAQKDVMAENDKDRLERMFGKLADTTSSMTGHLVGSKDQQKEEYKERLVRQEDRMDNTQDKALDYTTRNNSYGVVNQSANTNIPPPPNDYFINIPGQQAIPRQIDVLKNMIRSGEIVAATSIFSPLSNSWIPASTIPELTVLFSDQNTQAAKLASCKNCGSDLIENTKFCKNCGSES